MNSASTVRDDVIGRRVSDFSKPHFDGLNDRHRRFCTWIIGRNHGHVGVLSYHTPHARPFAAVAVASCAEDKEDSTGRDAPGSLEDVTKGVIAVGIIHQHTKRLPLVNALDTAGHRP